MFNIYFKEMKKFFSLIALVGVFAACNPEDLTTAFSVAPATATLNVTVVSATPGFVAPTPTYSPSQTITGTPTIAAGTAMSASATYGGVTGTYSTTTPLVLAGASINLNGVINIPYDNGKYVISTEVAGVNPTVVVNQLKEAAHGHGTAEKYPVEVDGVTYEVSLLENANEFFLCDSFAYSTYTGTEVVSYKVNEDDFAADVVLLAAAFDGTIEEKVETVPFTVSAWALYNVVNPVATVETTFNVIATPSSSETPALANPVVGQIVIKTVDSAYLVWEQAHPNHAAHYEPTHGVGHGDGSNAGGGLVEAE